jgi:hypothetical protein
MAITVKAASRMNRTQASPASAPFGYGPGGITVYSCTASVLFSLVRKAVVLTGAAVVMG